MSDLVVVFRTDTGAAVSLGTTLPTLPLPAGLDYLVFQSPTWEESNGDPGYVWDPATRTPQPRPVPVTIVVSDNLRTKMKASIDEVVNVGFPAITAAQTAVDEVIAANPSNVSQVVTQYEKLAAQVRTSLRANEEALARVCAITRLLLGDFYGDADTLQSEAGTEAA
jgi:hypothetical protein